MRRHETLILAALLVLFVLSAYALRFTVDDAYIAMRYSRNLAEGRGLVYNAGEYVEGFTSPLWVLILAAAHALGVNMVTASHVIGTALSVLTIVLVHRMAARAFPDGPVVARLIPVVFLATSWIYAGWATGGLETALYACVTVLGVSHLQTRVPISQAAQRGAPLADGKTDWLPLIGLLIVLTRPEGFLMAGVLGLASLASDWKDGRERMLATIRRWAVWFALPVALLLAWRLSYYGEWLPNTFYVKVNKVEYIDRGWPFFVSFAKDSFFYLWGPVALAAALLRDLVSRSILAYSTAYILYTIWVGGDWMGYRFYHHLLPLLAFPIAVTLARLRRAPAMMAMAAMTVAIVATASKNYSEGRATALTMGELDNYGEMDTPEAWAIEIARGLNAVLRPGEAASASFAGFTAVYTNHTVVDSLGLTDKYVAGLPAVPGGPGHEKFAPREYLVSRNVLLVDPWPGNDPAQSNRRYALQYEPGSYVYFDALVPPARVAEILHARGLGVWLDGRRLFDRLSVDEADAPLAWTFESGTWDGWVLSGTAFGRSPGQGATWSNAPAITGAQGRYFVNTFHDSSDAAVGTARSPDFVIAGDVIHFLIAGGALPGTALELWVDGKQVRAASGQNTEDLVPAGWNVGELRGQKGYLLIRDVETGPWGHIVVDDIHVGRSKALKTN